MKMKKKTNSLANKLAKISHDYIRERDSSSPNITGGLCCTCQKYVEGGNFQAGHYEPDSTGGALLRYHPHNMHGQGGYCCNINKHGQQRMANAYTMFMIKKYGLKYVEKLRALKYKSIKADEIFYNKMIELYKAKDEKKIVKYIESLI